MVEVKELKTLNDLKELGEIENRVWGMPALPTHQTLTAIKNGGIIIGAYDNEKLIGFSYGFAGFNSGNSYLCSHMLGIDEAYRSRKIGEQLKQKQRTVAIDKGYTTIHWTFDPLETRNAYLNLSKLKGICDTYIENAYGDMKDGINKGIPSDRFEVHWYLTSPHVVNNTEIIADNPTQINSITIENGLPQFSTSIDRPYTDEFYALDVPKNFQGLKKNNHDIALNWRYKTRIIFQDLFAAGYTAVKLIPRESTATYIFVKKEKLNIVED